MIWGAKVKNMPLRARFDQALYAVSKERQFHPRLFKARPRSSLPQGSDL
jgi:hypothetical protein